MRFSLNAKYLGFAWLQILRAGVKRNVGRAAAPLWKRSIVFKEGGLRRRGTLHKFFMDILTLALRHGIT